MLPHKPACQHASLLNAPNSQSLLQTLGLHNTAMLLDSLCPPGVPQKLMWGGGAGWRLSLTLARACNLFSPVTLNLRKTFCTLLQSHKQKRALKIAGTQ